MSKSTGRLRIELIDPDNATGRVGRLFADIRLKFGVVPNLFRVFANAPAALEGFVNLGSALSGRSLDEKTHQRLALAVAECNLCSYCLSAHTFIARRIGLTPAEIDDAIKACASDAKTDAILRNRIPSAQAAYRGLFQGDIYAARDQIFYTDRFLSED